MIRFVTPAASDSEVPWLDSPFMRDSHPLR